MTNSAAFTTRCFFRVAGGASGVFGLAAAPTDVFDPAHGGVVRADGLGLGLGDVGEALLGLDARLHVLQGSQAGRRREASAFAAAEIGFEGRNARVDLGGRVGAPRDSSAALTACAVAIRPSASLTLL